MNLVGMAPQRGTPLGVRGGPMDMLSAYLRKHHANGNESLRKLLLADDARR